MRSMLEEHGAGLDKALRINIYLRNMSELPEIERIAKHFFGDRRPAGTVIGVESLARRDFFIEIEAITTPAGLIRRSQADDRVASWGRYVDAVRGGDLVFVSGIVGYDARSGVAVKRPADLASSSAQHAMNGLEFRSHEQLAAAAQTQSILDQLQVVLESVDSNLASVLKLTVYLRDMSEFPIVRRVLLESLGDDPPAITALAVADLPLRDARLQIEAVAL
jgi:enamine deaminase RidA (YjgF/YER057c/UK114 family)